MELNKSCIEILKYIREKGDYVKIQDLAKIYKLTDRAIRYKIDKIEAFLVKNGFKYLEKQHLKGVKLVIEPGINEFLDSFLGEYTPYKYIYSRDERFQFITMKILQSQKAIKISYFENKLCVSKNTIFKELNLIERWLNERDLKVIRKSRIGIIVEGKEENKRKAISEIAQETISAEDIVNYIKKGTVKSKINNLQFETLFSDIDIDFIDELIKSAESELNKEFSDEAYGSLITHITIMIKRVELDSSISIPQINLKNLKKGREYETAEKILKKIENHYKLKIPEEEVNYITLHLLGARVLKNNEIYNINEYTADNLYSICEKMVEEIENIYFVDFGSKKDTLIEGLVLHLRPSIYRIKFNLKLVNPLYEEIRMNYNELFLNTKLACIYLEDFIGSKIDDNEIAYISLHFGAALRNVKKDEKKILKVILVCGTGLGTAKMAATQILDKFHVEIVDIIPSRAVRDLKNIEYDYIISTIDIPYISSNSYIKVNPLMLKNDYDKLSKYLQGKYKKEESYETEMHLINRLLKVTNKYCTINELEQLKYEFMYEIKKERHQYSKKNFEYTLKDLLTPDFISLNVECRYWEEAIRNGMKVLREKNYVEVSYQEAIINNIKEFGPYMSISPGVVLSHAKSEDGVNKLSMSLMTIKNPVKFGSDLNDPIKLIVTLAAKDKDSHLRALSQLMTLFMKSDDLKNVFNAKTKDQVIDIINIYSNK